jgi:ABC-type uncharacterized transport system permease subunit
MKQFNGKAQPLRLSGAGRTHFDLHGIAIDPICGSWPACASLALHFSLSVSNYDGNVYVVTLVVNLLQVLVSQFFGSFVLASSEIKQSLLKPSLLGPIPIPRRKQVSVVTAIIHSALEKD